MKRLAGMMVIAFLLGTVLSAAAQRIQPEDLEYQGAFRLPEGSNGSTWEYSGYAMTYYPNGDPTGPNDGYPGSLFALGHDHQQYVSEISIPVPVVSTSKDVEDLNTAATQQPFYDITGGMFGALEIPRAGLAYLGPQGSQTTGKLHFCWGQHFQDFEASHGWCEVTLSNPQTAGPWHFGGYTNYVTNDYLFPIPSEWASAHTPGQLLATGRFRDGVWGGRGPTLFAYGPWNDGNPPAPNATLSSLTPLLLYGVQEAGAIEITSSEEMMMDAYKEPDEWSGGAWLTAGSNAAVVFVGTKALGNSWYGYANGVTYPTSGDEDAHYPPLPPWPYDQRGYWSDDIEPQMLFYDPVDLAGVAAGTMETYDPQPYAVMSLDPAFFHVGYDLENEKRYLVGAAAFDRTNGLLYVMERRADEEKSLVHVWKVTAGASAALSRLYFPSIRSDGSWDTELGLINTSATEAATGTVRFYSDGGEEVSSAIPLSLPPHGRREVLVSADLSDPSAAAYAVCETSAGSVKGYVKFFISGQWRAGVPAISRVNGANVSIPHIASDANWTTYCALLNTSALPCSPTIEFNDGSSQTISLAAYEHRSFNIRELFDGQPRPGITSGVIRNANGLVGLELFSMGNQLAGVVLHDERASAMYYPHVVMDPAHWITGIVAYNPAASSCTMTVKPYEEDGTELPTVTTTIDGGERYFGTVTGLGLPGSTAWVTVTASKAITGFEAFINAGNGNQLAGYSGVRISGREGVLPKLERDGWTGVTIVNVEGSNALVTLTAYDDAGTVIATETREVGSHEKYSGAPSAIFSGDISGATYLAYSSDKDVVAFQANGSSDGMMLDALEGM
ncbi:MAG: hypothetical protein JXD19_10140 [Deltaproteobacteria bacterium]|nr:hypothetical protein [Deltaproteobacteria bacterium]